MLYVGSSGKSFHCDCLCNVFHRAVEPRRYICNSCGTKYNAETSEKEKKERQSEVTPAYTQER